MLLLLLAGCPKGAGPAAPLASTTPAELLARARAEPQATPLIATFGLHLEGPDTQVRAQGTLLIAPPDRFRIEIRGPIGPPQVVVVSDGTTLRTWLAGKNEVWTLDSADAEIAAWTGGDAGLEAVGSLLLGRLPALGEPDAPATDEPQWRWSGPEQSHLDARLDPRTAHLAMLSLADPAGASVLEAEVEGGDLPTRLVARVPPKAILAELSFDAWKPAAPPDAAFTLLIPPTATVRPVELRPAE